MQPVKCLGLVCAGCLGVLALAGASHGIYFTMELKNGNELVTDYYSVDNNSIIHFFTKEGEVKIPKSIIKNIKSNDGTVTVELEESEQNRQTAAGGENEDGEKRPTAGVSEKEAAQARLSSITDQLAVIGRANRVATVFHEPQIAAPRKIRDRAQVERIAQRVGQDHGPGPG